MNREYNTVVKLILQGFSNADCNQMCNASDPSRSHPAEYAVDASSDTWWQTISWLDYPQPLHTTYTISFDKLYRLTDDLIITFYSGLLLYTRVNQHKFLLFA